MRVTSDTSTVATFQLRPVRTAAPMLVGVATASSAFGTTASAASPAATETVFASLALIRQRRRASFFPARTPAYDPLPHGGATQNELRPLLLDSRAALRGQARASLPAL